MAKTVSIDVIDKSIPSDNTRNIPIINQPNPCKGYAATAKEVAQLIKLASYYVYAAGTTNVIDGYNFFDYFPEEGSSSGGGGLSRTEIQAMIDASIPTLDTAMSSTSRNGVENRVIKEFVNSSIASSTGTFRGTFDSVDELNAYSGDKKNNDYAYVVTKDTTGLSKQSKYKYVADTDTWTFEYDINNTTFTAAQTAAINSGITDTDVAKITSNKTAIGELNIKVTNHEDTMTKASAHIIDKKNPHDVTKAQIGLGDVDNTSDMEKPISTLTQTALDAKVDKIDGKQLSTNDFTDVEKAQIETNKTDIETHTSNNDIHVTTDEKTSWNNAATASHSHENKTILDGITEEKITAYNKAVTDDHTHSNKDVIDTITQENIDKWNSGGASYIPGQGISISDDNVISTDFTILSNEISVATTTKLVSSESKVASLSMIGSLIKEDQSLVTKDELDSKVPKVNIDFSSETSIDVNQTTEVKTGSYEVTSDCFAGCYITETSESITANAYATISVDGKPVCSVVNDGTITAGIGNVIRVPKGTTINYTLKSNGIQTASVSVFNCI